DGRKEAGNGQSQKYRYFHRTKTNNTSRVSQVAAASEFAKSQPIVKNIVFFHSEESEHEQVLRYNADILRQLASASGPPLHDAGRRYGGALQAPARFRDLLFDRDR